MTRSMAGFFNQIGMMFYGQRDLYTIYGYPPSLNYQAILGKYRRQDLAARIVDSPANAIWANPPEFEGSPDNIKNTFQELVTRLDLWQILNRADKLCGIGKYSAIIVGVNDGQSLATPVGLTRGERKITFLQPYSEMNLEILQLEIDESNPRFGKPKMYNLKSIDTSGGTTDVTGLFKQPKTSETQVHWSRVIHIAEGVLEDDTYGSPRLEKVFNLLEDMLKVAGGSAEMYWLNARGGIHVNIDKEMELDPLDEADLSEELQEYSDQLRRVIRTRGVEVNPIVMQVADPRMTFDVLISLISAATGIPQRILMGAEAGQLASAQDRANWAVTVEERRASFAQPRVLRPLCLKLIDLGFFTLEDLMKIVITWPEAFKLNPLERGQTSAQQARAAANLIKVFELSPDLISADMARGIIALAAPGARYEDKSGLGDKITIREKKPAAGAFGAPPGKPRAVA